MKLKSSKSRNFIRYLIFFGLSIFSALTLAGGLAYSRVSAEDNPVPPISRCSQADGHDKQEECRHKYQQCNPPPPWSIEHIQDCKRQVINHYTSGGGGGDLGCQMVAGDNQCADGNGGAGGAAAAADTGHQCGNLSDEGRNVNTKFNFGCLGKDGPTGLNPILDIIYALIRFASVGVGIAIVISMILAGIQYSAAEGKAESTQKAKLRIQQAVIGLAIYIFAF